MTRSTQGSDVTKTERPHWVNALDQGLTHTSYPEYWNRSIVGDTSEEEYKHNVQKSGQQSKKKSHKGEGIGGGGDDKMSNNSHISHGSVAKGNRGGGGGIGYRGYTGSSYRSRHSDTASLTSRVTSSTERHRRHRSRVLAVCLILTILAFLLAALLGWLLYYLLMKDDPRRDRVIEGPTNLNASLSVRVLNKEYTPAMANTSSADFHNVHKQLCGEMDDIFQKGNLSHVYLGCHVERIRNVADVPDCQCYRTKFGNLLIDFQLAFNGTHNEDDMRWTIYDVTEGGTVKHFIDGTIYVYIGDFLVDIRPYWKSYDGLQAEVTMPVYNLNYTYMLGDPTSSEFRKLGDPFCDEVSMILATKAISPFRTRYHSCQVSKFKTRPNRITFFVHMTGREWRSVQRKLIYVLLMGARNGTIMQQPVKMIGPLAVTSWSYNIDFTIRPINITDITTPAVPTSTTLSTQSTSPAPKPIYVYSLYRTYNLTLTDDLRDPGSQEFKRIRNELCVDLERLFDLSVYGYRFYSCELHSFRSNPTSVVVSVGYLGNPWPEMDTSVTWVIRQFAPKFYFDLNEVYLVGGIYLLFDQITANGLELRTSLQVLNLTYGLDLADQRSQRFQYHSQRFCQDMTKFYAMSYLKDRFFECGVDRFTDNPVQIHFYLVFYGTSMAGLPESINDLIRRNAPPFYYLVYLAYLVGELLVLPEEMPIQPSVYPTNITAMPPMTSTSFVTVTSSQVIPSTVFPPIDPDKPRGILVIFHYQVHNLTFTNDLRDPNSQRFLEHKYAFCDDMWRWYMGRSSPFRGIYRACNITSFSDNPIGVTFTLLFETKWHSTLTQAVRSHLEYSAPKVFLPGLYLLDVGNLLLIMDRYDINVTTTIVPSHTLVPPTMTPPTILSTSFTLTPTPTTMTLSSMASSSEVTASTTGTPGQGVTVTYWGGLADFVFTQDLNDKNSPRFKYLEQRFCKDIDGYYLNSPLKDLYKSCYIREFRQSERQDYPETVSFSLVFNTLMFYELEQQIKSIFLKNPPRVPRSGYLTLHVGDLYLIIDFFTTELPGSITTRLIYSPTITIATTNSPSYAPTPTRSLTPTPTSSMTSSKVSSTSMTSSSVVVMPTTTSTAATTRSLTPSPTTPTVPTLRPKPTYFIRMSFETLNLTRETWLSDPRSPEFIQVQQFFCSDMDKILNAHERFVPKFIDCSIDSFGGDPLRVNFSLQFHDLEGKSRGEVKDLVVSMLVENAIRKEFNNVYALLIGNLLIAVSSITVEFSTLPPTSNLYNAIAYNYTFFTFPGNFSRDLMNRQSGLFRITAYEFCQDVDSLFANVGLRTVRSRYYGCAVDGYGSNGEIKFTISLTDTEIVRPSTMFNIFAYGSDQVFLDGIFYLKFGDLYYAIDIEPLYYLIRLDSFTTHPYPYSTTTAPSVNTIITLTLDVLQPDWSAELTDVSSARYSLLADSFCSDVSAWISEWKKDYIGCDNVRFSQNPFQITTELIFRGLQETTLENVLNTIILERADWLLVDNLYAMAIGSMLIYDKSLVLTQRTVSVIPNPTPPTSDVTPTTSPSSATPSPMTTPSPTTPAQPCVGTSGLAVEAHPTLCDRFFRCVMGQAYLITCVPGSVFQGATCVEKPAGFVCQK